MAHLCVPQNQTLGVCRGFVPDIQVCGTRGREDLVNATITSNAEEEEDEKSEPMLTPREKSLLAEAQRRVEPATLHHAGQRAQHTTDWAIPASAGA